MLVTGFRQASRLPTIRSHDLQWWRTPVALARRASTAARAALLPATTPTGTPTRGIWYNDDDIPQSIAQERAAETKRALRQQKLLVQLARLRRARQYAYLDGAADDDEVLHPDVVADFGYTTPAQLLTRLTELLTGGAPHLDEAPPTDHWSVHEFKTPVGGKMIHKCAAPHKHAR